MNEWLWGASRWSLRGSGSQKVMWICLQGCISRLQKEYKAFLKVHSILWCSSTEILSLETAMWVAVLYTLSIICQSVNHQTCQSLTYARQMHCSSLKYAEQSKKRYSLSGLPKKEGWSAMQCTSHGRPHLLTAHWCTQADSTETKRAESVELMCDADDILTLSLIQEPPPGIKAHPNPNNILEWHYALEGHSNSPFEGGVYHGE